jgi:TrmH family RNA methyltransferase
MFPLRKLKELPQKSRMRKMALILQNLEIGLAQGKKPEKTYIHEVCELARKELLEQAARSSGLYGEQAHKSETAHKVGPQEAAAAQHTQAEGQQGATAAKNAVTDKERAAGTGVKASSDKLDAAELLRFLNDLRHQILAYLGAEPAEWDFLDFAGGLLDRASRTVLPLRVYMEDIRSPFNVGSIFRTSEAFGVKHVYLSPHTPLPTHKKAAKTARGCEMIVKWSVEPLSVLQDTEEVFALELGGKPLHEFKFPKQGVVLIGSEELGLSPDALALADSRLGRVSIPMAGAKRSLNVATAFGILMQRWYTAVTAKA